MKTKLNPALAGMFVLGAFVLIVVGLVSFRSAHLFSRPQRFVAYFRETVQGLDLGSNVKLRGVRVGRVVSIRVRYEIGVWPAPVAVVGELDINAIADANGTTIKLTDRATLTRLVEEGLRARLDLVGITGLQFVQLDFRDPRVFPAPSTSPGAEGVEVPTVPSEVSELMANLSKIVLDLKKADFAEVAQSAKALLATANQKVGELDFKALGERVTAAADAIAAVAGSPDTRAVLTNVTQTVLVLQATLAKVDQQIEPLRGELEKSLQSFRGAAESVSQLVAGRGKVGLGAVDVLRQVSDATASLQRLADFVQRNPNALLSGRKRPEVSP